MNKDLLLSLTFDLKGLQIVSNEIKKNCKSYKIKSWLNPTKTFEDFEDFDVKNLKSDALYKICLESLVDRLYLTINLISLYLDEQVSQYKEPLPRNISKPNSLSFTVILQTIWRNILVLEENKLKQIKTESDGIMSPLSTQTEESALSCCDSCAISKQCIKDISNNIVKTLKSSDTEKAKETLQTELCDLTQFGCMNRLTFAINQDIQYLLSKHEYYERSNARLDEKNKILNEKMSQMAEKVNSLEEHLKWLSKKLEEERETIVILEASLNASNENVLKMETENKMLVTNAQDLEKLKEENEAELKRVDEDRQRLNNVAEELNNNINCLKVELADKNGEINQLRNETDKLGIKLREKEKSLKGVQNEVKLFEDKFKTQMDDIEEANKQIDNWKERFLSEKGVNQRIREELDKEREQLEQIKSSFDKICERLGEIDKFVKSKEEILGNGYENFVDKLKKIERQIESPNNLLANSQECQSNLCPLTHVIKMTGNPLKDMINQLEVNNKNIRILENQNMTLSKTIQRLHSLNEVSCKNI